MKKTSIKNPLLLLLAAIIWGSAFVAQSVGMEHVGPFTFNCIRSLLGGLVLLPCIWLLGKLRSKDSGNNKETAKGIKDTAQEQKTLLTGGICCGVMLFAASTMQQFGIQYTSVGKAGFITALYIVMVPIFGIFLHKKAGLFVWLGVVLAVAGLYFLCITESVTLEKGDLFVLLCAILFAVHILVIDHFSPHVDGVKMSCIQFFVCGLLSAVFMLFTEQVQLENIISAGPSILYAGIFSSGVAYTLQIVGQSGMNPTVASMILSLESVVAVLSGWLLLGQQLSVRELFGCFLMFAAIVLAQIPVPEAKKQNLPDRSGTDPL